MPDAYEVDWYNVLDLARMRNDLGRGDQLIKAMCQSILSQSRADRDVRLNAEVTNSYGLDTAAGVDLLELGP